MGVFFVKRRSDGVHCLVRVVPVDLGCTLPSLDDSAARGLVTKLMTAKTLTTLSRAVGELPLLLPISATSVLSLSTLEGVISDRYVRCDQNRLARESVYHVIGQDPLGDAAAVSAAMTRYDGLGGMLAREVSTARQDVFVVVEEPLLDWIYARAHLGLVGRLLSAASESAAPLESAGFERSHVAELGRDVWHLRFLHNTFHEPKRGKPYYAPLFNAAAGAWEETEGPRKLPFRIPPRCLSLGAPSDRAYFLTSQSVTLPRKYADAMLRADEVRDQSLHICIDDSGDQLQDALDVLASLKHTMDRLTFGTGNEAIYVGADDNPASWTESPAGMHPKPLSLLPDLTYRLLDRGYQRIAVCRECGSPMLQNDKGRVKEYCSTLCRRKYAAHRQESEKTD